jgi:hypothetical protein
MQRIVTAEDGALPAVSPCTGSRGQDSLTPTARAGSLPSSCSLTPQVGIPLRSRRGSRGSRCSSRAGGGEEHVQG